MTRRRPRALAPLALLPILAAGSSAPARAGTPASIPAYIEHRGYEAIVAGPDVPVSLGLPTTPGYSAAEVALNDAGTRLWFVLFDWIRPPETPEYEVWTILADGTGAQQIELTEDHWDGSDTGLPNLFVDTDGTGTIAVLSSSEKFSRIDLSDPLPVGAEQMFALDPFGRAGGGLRVTDDGTTAVFLDNWNERIVKVDLLAGAPAPVEIADSDDFVLDTRSARSLFAFDLAAGATDWWVYAENFFGVPYSRNRYWLTHGSGLGAPTFEIEPAPVEDRVGAPIVEVSDDGTLLLYCPEANATVNDPRRCFLQEPGSMTPTEVGAGDRDLGRPRLAGDGARAYVLADPNVDTPYGFRFRTADVENRLVAGTQRLAANAYPAFENAELSDDGRVLVAPTELGVYVQHDGASPPAGFPRVDSIRHAMDTTADELIVQVQVSPSTPILERIYTLPLLDGIEPSRSLDEPENPLWSERNGGGVNFSTEFDDLGGGLWQRHIPMDGKSSLLTSRFGLRIVLVHEGGTRTSYYDFRPSVLFGDGFESGDSTLWSSGG